MANYCAYDMRVRGNRKAVNKLLRILQYKDKKYHFFRVFDAEMWDMRIDEDDETLVTASIYGNCAWSVAACMTGCDWSYAAEVKDQQDCATLQSMSEKLHLDIEVWSEEPGVGFQEHYRYRDGEELENECFDDYVYAYWDTADYPNFADFAAAIGHPELTEDDLDDGYIEIKHDPVFEF